MNEPVSRRQAQAFLERWKLVNQVEIEELKNTSYKEKFAQLSSLMSSVKSMGWSKVLKDDVDRVRGRWLLLRKSFKI